MSTTSLPSLRDHLVWDLTMVVRGGWLIEIPKGAMRLDDLLVFSPIEPVYMDDRFDAGEILELIPVRSFP